MSRNTVTEALAAQMLQEQDELLSRLESASHKLDDVTTSANIRLETMTAALEKGADNFRGAVTQFIDIAKKDIEEAAQGAAKRSIIATANEQQQSLKEAAAAAFNKETFDELRRLSESFQRFKAEQRAQWIQLLMMAGALALLSGVIAGALVAFIFSHM